ncbi:hypothetical protein [Agromyces aureus]|nr:hypothetical protein [Agromyces aureus]
MTVPTRSRRKTVSALLVIPAILFALSACAPASGGDGATGGGDAGGANGSTAGGGNENSEFDSMFDWQLAYTECMRGEGIDMPDPEKNGAGMAMKLGSEDDMDAMMAAGEKCQKELGDPPPPSPEEKAASDQEMLKWATKTAECYRENGYDMADPKLGEMPQFPEDVPEEVMAECGGGASAVTKVQ